MKRVMLAFACALLTAGCGAAATATAPVSPAGATPEDHAAITTHAEHRFNDRDVMFLQMMVAHNGEGVRLSRLVAGRPVREEVRTLVAAMAATQKSEATTMAGWLADRDRPPTAAPDEHTAHGGMPGTSPEEIAAVENATGPAFERKLLDLLIAHQDDAAQMARAEVTAGIDPEITALARRMDVSRTAQITTMLTLRAAAVPPHPTPEASGGA